MSYYWLRAGLMAEPKPGGRVAARGWPGASRVARPRVSAAAALGGLPLSRAEEHVARAIHITAPG